VKKRNAWIIGITAAAICVAGGAGYYFWGNKESVPETSVLPEGMTLTEGSVAAAGLTSVGMLEELYELDFLEDGLYVEETYLNMGDEVEEGTPVFRVSEESLENARKELEKKVQETGLNRRQGEITYQTGLVDAQKDRELAAVEAGYAQQVYDSAVQTAQEEVDSAQEKVDSAQEKVDEYTASIEEDYYYTYYEVAEKEATWKDHAAFLMELYEKWDVERLEDLYGGAGNSAGGMSGGSGAAAGGQNAVGYVTNQVTSSSGTGTSSSGNGSNSAASGQQQGGAAQPQAAPAGVEFSSEKVVEAKEGDSAESSADSAGTESAQSSVSSNNSSAEAGSTADSDSSNGGSAEAGSTDDSDSSNGGSAEAGSTDDSGNSYGAADSDSSNNSSAEDGSAEAGGNNSSTAGDGLEAGGSQENADNGQEFPKDGDGPGVPDGETFGDGMTAVPEGAGSGFGGAAAISDNEIKYNIYQSMVEETDESKEAYETALENYEDAKAKAEAGIAEAKSELTVLQAKLEEQKKSYEEAVLSAKLTYDLALSNNETAQMVYEAAVKQLEEDYDLLKEEEETAAENLALFEETLGDGIFYTGSRGTVMMTAVRSGAWLTENTVVMAYSNPDTVTIAANVDQADIAFIEIGEEAFVVVSGYGTYAGTVTSMNPVSESRGSSSVTYTVNVQLEGDISSLEANLTAYTYFGLTDEEKEMLSGSGGQNGSRGQRPDGGEEMPGGDADMENMPEGMERDEMPGGFGNGAGSSENGRNGPEPSGGQQGGGR